MNFSNTILSVLTWLPLLGAAVLLFTPKASLNAIRWMSLIVTLIVFVLSLAMWQTFDPSNPGFQFVVNMPWIGDSIGYRVGVDGISVLFVVLSALLMPFCILASWEAIDQRIKEYMIVFLVLETLMIGVFTTLDLAMFYVFFEGTLLPMFLIIGILTASEAKNAHHSQGCQDFGKSWVSSLAMSVVPPLQNIAMMASSISTEPMKV